MNLKVHDRGQDEKSIWTKYSMDLIDRSLRIWKMFKGFEVQHQSDAFTCNRFHFCDIADDINAGRIEISHILLNILFPWEERLVKIRLPSCAGIKDRFLKRESCNGPSDIVDNRFSQLACLSLRRVLHHPIQDRKQTGRTGLIGIIF